MLRLRELDDRVRLADQLAEEVGAVILINTFTWRPRTSTPCWRPGRPTPPTSSASRASRRPVAPRHRRQRGVLQPGGLESVQAFRNAFGDPQFQATALTGRLLIIPASLVAATRDENRVVRPSSALLGARAPVDKTDAGDEAPLWFAWSPPGGGRRRDGQFWQQIRAQRD
jgi:hypothetical protein